MGNVVDQEIREQFLYCSIIVLGHALPFPLLECNPIRM